MSGSLVVAPLKREKRVFKGKIDLIGATLGSHNSVLEPSLLVESGAHIHSHKQAHTKKFDLFKR